MESGERYYFVGVRFRRDMGFTYSYLCGDFTVGIGDEVLVPVTGGIELIGTVVSAGFFSADHAPYPPKKAKTVIRSLVADQRKTENARLISVLRAVKEKREAEQALAARLAAVLNAEKEKEKAGAARLVSVLRAVNEKREAEQKERQTVLSPASVKAEKQNTVKKKISDVLYDLFGLTAAIIVGAPIITLIFGFILAFVMILFGWEADENAGAPFLIAIPAAICFCIYACFSPAPPPPAKPEKRSGKRYRGTGSGTSSEGSCRTPGCPEETSFSGFDSLFDFDGDGHLDAFESSAKYDFFFGDDE